jgi:hypothetical protein
VAARRGRVACSGQRTRHDFDATSIDTHRRRREACADTAGQVVYLELRQVFRQAQTDVVEREVSRQLLQAAVGKVRPGAHATAAMRQGERVIQPGAPGRQVGRVDLGEGLPRPRGEVFESATTKVPAQIEFRRQSGRRQGRQAEAVVASIVVDGED